MKKGRFIKIFVLVALSALIMSMTDMYFEISKNIDVFTSLYRQVNEYYVDEVDPSKLMRTCIDGMLKTLDPFTNYFSESQIESAKIQQGGKFGGIGIEIEMINGYPVVTAVTEGQPADKAGIKVGDVVSLVDGESTHNRKKEEVDKVLVGQPNSLLALNISRPTNSGESEQKTFQVTRLEIQETSVPFYGMITPEIGCVKLKMFNQGAGADVKNAFDSLQKANPKMKGVILDLRDNPGGLLNEAVNIVNIFVDRNTFIVDTRGKVDEWNKRFSTLNEPSDTKIPIVVITNSMSASASEIVSGALQDLDRGVIIGQRTYGKGLVQTTKPLSYNTMLKVTTAKYYIPTGRCIQALNYAEKNADGSVKRIPDSLKVAFKTLRTGRTVYDGGGIDPDVILPKPTYSILAETLFVRHYLFDFATQYTLKHPSVSNAADFRLTDEDFNNFVEFVKTKDCSYSTDTEEKLKALKAAAEEEKYFDALKEQYETIVTKLAHDKEQDLKKHKEEIMTLLENEIVGRYYYAYGKVKKSYQNDSEVARAVALLNTPSEYNSLLQPTK